VNNLLIYKEGNFPLLVCVGHESVMYIFLKNRNIMELKHINFILKKVSKKLCFLDFVMIK